MKSFAVLALALSQAAAFSVVPRHAASPSTQLFAEYEPMDGEGKINLKIDLDSPKVATMVCQLKDYFQYSVWYLTDFQILHSLPG